MCTYVGFADADAAVLTFVTGMLDAVGFLALGHVFVAMQTGNVIFLGIGLGGAAGAPVLAPLIALAAFLAYLLIALLATAMGLRNTIARRIGDPSLATTVLNLTVTAFASHTPLALASRGELETRGAAIGAILAGALCGALLLKVSLALTIAAAAAVVLAALSFLLVPATEAA